MHSREMRANDNVLESQRDSGIQPKVVRAAGYAGLTAISDLNPTGVVAADVLEHDLSVSRRKCGHRKLLHGRDGAGKRGDARGRATDKLGNRNHQQRSSES